MELAVARIAPQPAKAEFPWPIPPFFRLASGLDERHATACSIELLNGNTIIGDLRNFDPRHGRIILVTADPEGQHHIKLRGVRTIRLTTPLALVRDVGLIDSVNPQPGNVAEERTFTVRFRDGKTLAGTTRGFVKEAVGLFLYLQECEHDQSVRCFVPAQQLGTVQIGVLLGETLLCEKQVSSDTLVAALGKQTKLREEKLGEHLADRGVVSPDDLKSALRLQEDRPAAKLGIPFVNVREFPVEPTALEALSADIAARYRALPLLQMGYSLVIAVEDPLAMDFVQDLRVLTGKTIVPVIANPEDLRLRIAKEYSSLGRADSTVDADTDWQQTPGSGLGSKNDVTHIHIEDLASALVRETSAPIDTRDNASDARVTDNALVRLVNKIIIDAYSQGASDIHIECNSGKANTHIRFRKDGDLEEYLELQPAYSTALVSRIKIMANLDISERRHAQDGKIAFGSVGPVPIDLRVAVVPTSNGREDVVLRILGGVEPLPMGELGLCARDLAELNTMIVRSYGLILVCGPTGSGKTTTLHSVLHQINRPDIKIWTAEDPVEIAQAGLRQVQINSRIDWTFAAAMRAFLRADPDVIMIGEMRDPETSKIAIEASLTGHLVFSTLHTNSAAESVVRLLDLGMDPFNFADALVGVLSQRLARKLCLKCKRSHPCSDLEISELLDEYCAGTDLDRTALLDQWRKDFAIDGVLVLYEAVGCEACRGGYKGRVGVYELLSGTAEVKQLVRSRGTVPQVVAAARAGGMRLLRQDAIEQTLRGILDRTSARSVSS